MQTQVLMDARMLTGNGTTRILIRFISAGTLQKGEAIGTQLPMVGIIVRWCLLNPTNDASVSTKGPPCPSLFGHHMHEVG